MAIFSTFANVQQRYLDLIGDAEGTIDDFGKRNINQAILDIVNRYSFSWNITTTTITLAAGVADLPNDFNVRWGLNDARIEVTGEGGDNVFTLIPFWDRDRYSSDDYVYWITSDPSNQKYVFNSHTQTGTVKIYYNYLPTTLTNDADVCFVPDQEAVAYLSASKNWIGAERDEALEAKYREIADRYITALYFRDMQQGPEVLVHNLAEYNLGA